MSSQADLHSKHVAFSNYANPYNRNRQAGSSLTVWCHCNESYLWTWCVSSASPPVLRWSYLWNTQPVICLLNGISGIIHWLVRVPGLPVRTQTYRGFQQEGKILGKDSSRRYFSSRHSYSNRVKQSHSDVAHYYSVIWGALVWRKALCFAPALIVKVS